MLIAFENFSRKMNNVCEDIKFCKISKVWSRVQESNEEIQKGQNSKKKKN